MMTKEISSRFLFLAQLTTPYLQSFHSSKEIKMKFLWNLEAISHSCLFRMLVQITNLYQEGPLGKLEASEVYLIRPSQRQAAHQLFQEMQSQLSDLILLQLRFLNVTANRSLDGSMPLLPHLHQCKISLTISSTKMVLNYTSLFPSFQERSHLAKFLKILAPEKMPMQRIP